MSKFRRSVVICLGTPILVLHSKSLSSCLRDEPFALSHLKLVMSMQSPQRSDAFDIIDVCCDRSGSSADCVLNSVKEE